MTEASNAERAGQPHTADIELTGRRRRSGSRGRLIQAHWDSPGLYAANDNRAAIHASGADRRGASRDFAEHAPRRRAGPRMQARPRPARACPPSGTWTTIGLAVRMVNGQTRAGRVRPAPGPLSADNPQQDIRRNRKMNSAGSLDVARFIDDLPIGRFHLRIASLCAAIVFMDGFDAQAIGYVAPSLSRAWSLPAGALGPVFGAGLFGIMLGALIGGPVADRIGRKKVI